MNYLLDVNVVVALLGETHDLHDRAERWVATLTAADDLLLCPWVEVGYIRVTLATRRDLALADAQRLLAAMRCGHARLRAIADNSRAAALPAWVKHHGHVGDGHLLALAADQGAKLATLDTGIPGSFLLP